MVAFITLAVLGVLVFSGVIPIGKSDEPGSLGTVILWGTVKSTTMGPLLEEFNNTNQSFVVQYVQKEVATLDRELLEALAEGNGPDMIFLPDNLAFHYANKIAPISYQNYPLVSFKKNFAGAGEVFLTKNGILALPLAIDPLVMYYNRNQLDANGIIYPPSFWDDLVSLIPTLIKKDETNKITKSPVALGHYSNVNHAKEILSALFMQTGNSIVKEQNGVLVSNLDAIASNPTFNLSSILKFYTDFADPNNSAYSWNKSFPNSMSAFSKEDLTFYFGFGSELVSLVNTNPNQNLGVTFFPQIRNANFKSTGARITGVAMLTSSRNLNTAVTVGNLMATSNFASKFAVATGMAPARRDLLRNKPSDAFSPVFYDSALYARSWLDPSPSDTNNIFRNMIDGVLSNRFNVDAAVSDADNKLNLLLLK